MAEKAEAADGMEAADANYILMHEAFALAGPLGPYRAPT
jgi:hypothetical protein